MPEIKKLEEQKQPETDNDQNNTKLFSKIETAILCFLFAIVLCGSMIYTWIGGNNWGILEDIVFYINISAYILFPIYSLILYRKYMLSNYNADTDLNDKEMGISKFWPKYSFLRFYTLYRFLLYCFFYLAFTLVRYKNESVIFELYYIVAAVLLVFCGICDLATYINGIYHIHRHKDEFDAQWRKEFHSGHRILLFVYLFFIYFMHGYYKFIFYK